MQGDEKNDVRQRLSAIARQLERARAEADRIDAHLLAAKIEDSRVCARAMLDGVTD